jgi:6-pyruvoyltetrahydropterin/6-carboxytetrahydropterin synthase
MNTIRITKEFKFEMAHALLDHDGPCKNIHGHSYLLSVTLKGNPIEDTSNPKEGMVVDFSDLKKLVNDEIVNPFDHALMLNKRTSKEIYTSLKDQKLILVEFQPTCENIIVYISKKLKEKLDVSLSLHHIMLRETATSFAEWYAEDNK